MNERLTDEQCGHRGGDSITNPQPSQPTYGFEQVLKAATDYFDGDEMAAKVWTSKYALKDSAGNFYELTPKDMHWRMAREISRVDSKYKSEHPLSEELLFDLFDRFKYLVPAGSPMTGIGNPFQISSIANCFVIGTDSDSYGGICKLDEEQLHLAKRRGGIGFDLSHIRPKGSPVKNSALTSTGLVPFMERYSNSMREVAQGGRRGALLLSCHVQHPDIENFIDAKLEGTKVTGANISVKLTDSFMKAVEDDSEFYQSFPLNSVPFDGYTYITPDLNLDNLELDTLYLRKGSSFKFTKAKRIWDKIVHNAWKSAEPGILFWNTITRESISDCYINDGFNVVSTNPCLVSWSTVLTPLGIRTLGDVKVGDKIWSETGWTTIINKVESGVKDVYEYRTTGGCFYGTSNHKILNKGAKQPVGEADGIDLLAGKIPDTGLLEEYAQVIMDGLVLGDGSVHKASNNLIYLCIGKDDTEYFNSEVKHLIGKHRTALAESAYEIATNISYEELPYTFERTIPDRYFKADPITVCMFLRGLYSANGSVVSGRVTFKTASSKLRDQLQILLSSVGIRSYYTTNQSKNVKFSNGDYQCKESYDINIVSDRDVFCEKIGFIQPYKMDKLKSSIKTLNKNLKTYKIVSTKYISTEMVYDITVDNHTHTYWTGGVNVSNCGELPLSIGEACRLLALNLYSYVVNPFGEDAYFDFELFKKHVGYATRVQDNLVDYELECIDKILAKVQSDPEPLDVKRRELELWAKIREKTIKGRRIGLGITAEGDMIAAMGLRYGTEEATDFAEAVHKTLAVETYKASIDLAAERGAFTIWDWEKEKDNPFLNRILPELDSEYRDRYLASGRRNITCLTIAPTGSVSLLTATSSGIEPVFMPFYKRRRKINPNDEGCKVDFVDEMGDSWEEYMVLHPKFKTWIEVSGYDPDRRYTPQELEELSKSSPYYKATSNDIDWVKKVSMQGRIQKWIDASISCTVNIPEESDTELVSRIYMEAWKSGCKGVTIYRTNSRAGVLVSATPDRSDPTPEKEPERGNQFHRPPVLEAEFHKFQNNKEKWIAVVGMLDGQPYEIFTGLRDDPDGDGLMIPDSATDLTIEKVRLENGGKRYDLHFKNTKGHKVQIEGLDQKFNPIYWNYARLISGLLRYEIPLTRVIKDLEGLVDQEASTINSWRNGVIRTLKKYVKDGERSGELCPECSQPMIYQEGCKACVCGYSKCGS